MKINQFLIAASYLFVLFSSFMPSSKAQVVWQESFAYPDGTTTGGNNNTANPAADWISSCATCLAGDYFEVRSGRMESNDSNGPARITTETIDISLFPMGVELSIDFSESGTMEGCPSGVSSGCNSIDFIRVEVSLDGGAFLDLSHPNGGPCAGACTDGDGTFVAIDDFGSFTFTECPLVGNSLRIRISVQEWASEEFHRIDNIILTPQSCILPIELLDFRVSESGSGAELKWLVAGNPGHGYFFVEKSQDGENFQTIGRVEISDPFAETSFSFQDADPETQDVYYRLKMVDVEGSVNYSPVELLHHATLESSASIYPNPSSGSITFSSLPAPIDLKVYDLHGRVVFGQGEVVDRQTIDLSLLPAGCYFVRLKGTGPAEVLKISINQY